jgi:hypothetical protein
MGLFALDGASGPELADALGSLLFWHFCFWPLVVGAVFLLTVLSIAVRWGAVHREQQRTAERDKAAQPRRYAE